MSPTDKIKKTSTSHNILFHPLEHPFGSMAPQVIGHRVNAIQGRLHTQAPNEVFGVVLVEVKGDLGHIFPGLVTGVTVKTGLHKKRRAPIKPQGMDGSGDMSVRRFVDRPTSGQLSNVEPGG